MSGQIYLYAFCNPGNEAWFKREVELRKLPWRLSFSRPGYLTFKLEGIELSELVEMDFAYARSVGLFIEKLKSRPSEFDDEQGKWIWECYENRPDEFWIGKRLRREHFNDCDQGLHLDFDKGDGPSRTYHKAREAYELLGLDKLGEVQVLELGCAPGGTTWFFLEKGLKVYGLDPAQMDERCLSHKNFTFFQKPVQQLRAADFKGKHHQIKLLSVDMNLMPSRSLREVSEVLKWLKVETVLLTLKTSQLGDIDFLETYKKKLQSFGFQDVQYLQLASHRRETLLFARQKRNA